MAVLCVAAGVGAGVWLWRQPSTPRPPVSVNADNAVLAVVNINGTVPGGAVAGSGMVIDPSGLVLTNNHVVANTMSLTGQVAGAGPVHDAVVIGVDPTHDVAVIRLKDASDLPTVRIDESGSLAVGDIVVGIGNALGRNGTPVSARGTVTSLDETVSVRDQGDTLTETLNGMICFDAAIEPGDSGGPLFNQSGRVIGMDTVGSSDAQAKSGCAIPITRAMPIARQIIAGVTSPYIESGHRGWLGVAVADSSDVAGAEVESVTPGDAAAAAGMTKGDVITEVGGMPITSTADLDVAMKGRRPGDKVGIAWRGASGALHRATVTLSPGPPA